MKLKLQGTSFEFVMTFLSELRDVAWYSSRELASELNVPDEFKFQRTVSVTWSFVD